MKSSATLSLVMDRYTEVLFKLGMLTLMDNEEQHISFRAVPGL